MVFHLQLFIFLINLVYTSLHEVVLQLKTSLLDFFFQCDSSEPFRVCLYILAFIVSWL